MTEEALEKANALTKIIQGYKERLSILETFKNRICLAGMLNTDLIHVYFPSQRLMDLIFDETKKEINAEISAAQKEFDEL